MIKTRSAPEEASLAARPLKLALVTATFPPYRGGTGNVCYHNARQLARLGHEVTVFTAGANQDEPEKLDGFVVHRLPALWRVGNAPVLPGLLTALGGFDLIHLHYPFFGGEITALAARLNHTPLVITYHQDVLLEGRAAWIERALRYSVGRWALRRASRVFYTSLDYSRASYSRSLLADRLGRVAEMPNGVDLDRFRPDPSRVPALRERLGLKPTDRVVLLVAGLDRAHYFKGVAVLLESLAARPDPALKAVIVGDGDLRESYQARAVGLGLAGRVIFAGRVSDEELPDYYRLAGVTVLPSLTMGEAFGLVLLEALACGTPVIASNLPGVRTVVGSGAAYGRLVEPGDRAALGQAIGEILGADPTRRLEMSRAGRWRVAEAYDWNLLGPRLEAAYREILDEMAVPPTRTREEGLV